MAFKLWYKTAFNGDTFVELTILDIINLRAEERGLGAGTLKVLLNRYDESQKEKWDNGFPDSSGVAGKVSSLVNYWIFVQNTDLVYSEAVGTTPAPTANNDPSIIWWGFIGENIVERQLNSGDIVGTLNVYQFGHFVNKFKINYFGGNANGFNPRFEEQTTTVGNKDINSTYPLFGTYGFKKYGKQVSLDQTSKDNFFTVKEAINHMIMRGVPSDFSTAVDMLLVADWSVYESSVDENRRQWLTQFETIESFEGESLTNALTSCVEGITYVYKIDDDNNIKVLFKPQASSSIVYQLELDESCESYSILSEQQQYDAVQLVGDRCLFFGALTTYSPMQENKTIGVFPKWTDLERTWWVFPKRNPANPLDPSTSFNESFDDLKNKDYLANGEDDPKDLKGRRLETTKDQSIERELAAYKALRFKYPNVYQDFYFGYLDPANPTGPDTKGTVLATWRYPGMYAHGGVKSGPENATEGANKSIAFFPFVSMQFTAPYSNSDGVITKKPIDTIKSDKDIIAYLDAGDARAVGTRYIGDQTPAATEMRYETQTVTEDIVTAGGLPKFIQKNHFEPTFYYRTYGHLHTFTNGVYNVPLWQDGCKGSTGYMSSKMSLDYDGVTLESEEPEVFACPDNAIYQDQVIPSDGSAPITYQPIVRDYSMMRDEWRQSDRGATRYDYYDPSPRTWNTLAHWGRMVFSFGAYSAQKLILKYGQPNAKNILEIHDPSYKLIIVRPGYVYGFDNYGLKYNEKNTILRNDLPKMAQRMDLLWEYYSKPKLAVKIVNSLFDVDGQVNQPLGVSLMDDMVGTYISQIKMEDGMTFATNSSVASVEFDFNAQSPRITIQTEYPDSPEKTRNKMLKSISKERKIKGEK